MLYNRRVFYGRVIYILNLIFQKSFTMKYFTLYKKGKNMLQNKVVSIY